MLTPLLILSGVGLVMAGLLAVGRKAFAVDVDERQEKIAEILPGANCGGCGFPGCSGFAAALVEGKADPASCPPGGPELAVEIGAILGVEVEAKEPMVALVACAGGDGESPSRAGYLGVSDCAAAHAVAGGPKSCPYGCLGLGSCIEACAFDAIVPTSNGLVMVDPEACTGCGKCVEACPRGIIRMVPKKRKVHVLCVNPDKAKAVKAACSVGCTGCKLCAKQTGAIAVDGALASVVSDSEEIPGSAALACPQGSIFDGGVYSLPDWLSGSEARADFSRRSAEWKKAEKERKAAEKKAKAEKAKEGEA